MSTQSLFLVHTLITISECVGMLWTCNIAILKQKYTKRSVLSFYTIVLSSSLKLASRVENVLCVCACVSPLLHDLGENSADNSGSWDTTPPVSLSLTRCKTGRCGTASPLLWQCGHLPEPSGHTLLLPLLPGVWPQWDTGCSRCQGKEIMETVQCRRDLGSIFSSERM